MICRRRRPVHCVQCETVRGIGHGEAQPVFFDGHRHHLGLFQKPQGQRVLEQGHVRIIVSPDHGNVQHERESVGQVPFRYQAQLERHGGEGFVSTGGYPADAYKVMLAEFAVADQKFTNPLDHRLAGRMLRHGAMTRNRLGLLVPALPFLSPARSLMLSAHAPKRSPPDLVWPCRRAVRSAPGQNPWQFPDLAR